MAHQGLLEVVKEMLRLSGTKIFFIDYLKQERLKMEEAKEESLGLVMHTYENSQMLTFLLGKLTYV